ncbi:MAG: SUF system NifU family Fe-S cluster assembly protein [Alphaproteobacteria bacterium]|nr:SUF system NifU family Fe-S cluster assembly protein [Alphaproteobacteria bacterium]MCK5621019.1 SUF system NifU family Fe-S cluster assembly protein [Alphaproteobacteria bacterium]
MFDDLRELYQEVILDHGKSPRNFREIDHAKYHAHGNNPMCGDQLEVFVETDDAGNITDASFLGKGCAISVASASLMTEMLRGKNIDEARKMFEGFHEMCTTGDDNALAGVGQEDADRLQVLSGVSEFPMRVKCATLAWHTMNAATKGEAGISTEDERG